MPYPIDIDSFSEDTVVELEELSKRLENAMIKHTSHWRKSGLLIDSVNSRPCKPIIDEIDWILARHYGFNEKETDFIINYDIKYRLGLEDFEDDA